MALSELGIVVVQGKEQSTDKTRTIVNRNMPKHVRLFRSSTGR